MATASDNTLFSAGLSVLAEGSDPNVDIIVVHEFDHKPPAESTWAEGSVFWPRDFLPQEFPRARILIYGYYYLPGFGFLRQRISDIQFLRHGRALCDDIEAERALGKVYMERPILFLCGGLGVVVVHEALTSCKRFCLTAKCTSGVIFLRLKSAEKKLRTVNKLDLYTPSYLDMSIKDTEAEAYFLKKGSDLLLDCVVDGYRFAEKNSPDLVAVTASIAMVLSARKPGGKEVQNSMLGVPLTFTSHGRLEKVGGSEEPVSPTRKGALDLEGLGATSRLFKLAGDCLRQGFPEEAVLLQLKRVEAIQEALGKDHPATLIATSNLEWIYWSQGRFSEAEELQVQVLEVMKRIRGIEHPSIATIMGNLVSVYSDQGRFAEAEELQVQVLEMRKKVLGESHPDTLTAIASLVVTYQSQGRWKEASGLKAQGLGKIDTKGKALGFYDKGHLPSHSTGGFHSAHDPSILPTTIASRYSWPARFASGKTDISFEIKPRWSLLNEAKGWIEDLVREPINWWPLIPRRHPLPEGYIWVHWKCRCGNRLSRIIPKERMNQYNQWLSSSNGPSSSPNHKSAPGTTPIHRTPTSTKAGGNQAPGNFPSLSPASTTGAISSTQIGSRMTAGGNNIQDKRLMWCVNKSTNLTLVTDLEILSSDNDATIFRKLRAKYWEIRGWRWWFSLYSISDIRFVRLKLYRLNRVICYDKEELPKPNNPYYEYQPRPPEEVPPVPVRELMEYFEDPSCAGTYIKTLEVLPKKTNGRLSLKEGYGWGLHACEHLSFLRTTILSTVILMGPIGFFCFWLVEHLGDLQNASVPLFLAFALIGTFVVLPHYYR